METDNKNKTTYKIKILYGAILFCMAFFVFHRYVQADESISSISNGESEVYTVLAITKIK